MQTFFSGFTSAWSFFSSVYELIEENV